MPQLMCIWMTKTQVADLIERLNSLERSTRDFFTARESFLRCAGSVGPSGG